MSKVDHPAHYGGADNPYEVIKVLRRWLTPTEFVGFCKGNTLKYIARANEKGGVEDFEKAAWYDREMIAFVREQRAAGEPDGMPLPAMYWTDLCPVPVDSFEEAVNCTEHGCVAMLCSSVEPHVRWFVSLGDDQVETEFRLFEGKAAADKFLAERLKEGQAQRAQAISDAHSAIRVGDTVKAASIADDHGLSWSHRAGDNFIMIEGTKVDIGPPDPAPPARRGWTPNDGA